MKKENYELVIPNETFQHMKAHPEVMDLLVEAKNLICEDDLNVPFAISVVDFGRIIGLNKCIEDHDSNMFALRASRQNVSRVAINKEGIPCSTLVVIHMEDTENTNCRTLVTAFIGKPSYREPWDPHIASKEEFAQSLSFWSQNALIWDYETMDKPFVSSWDEILKESKWR